MFQELGRHRMPEATRGPDDQDCGLIVHALEMGGCGVGCNRVSPTGLFHPSLFSRSMRYTPALDPPAGRREPRRMTVAAAYPLLESQGELPPSRIRIES
jgi:hypothetical protein